MPPNPIPDDPLIHVPEDWGGDGAQEWLKKSLADVKVASASDVQNGVAYTDGFICAEPGRFGRYGDAGWRRLVMATFAADLASYPAPVDQVNFERLAYVMHTFPSGFRVWFVRLGGEWRPVGYSGWHPIAEVDFARLEKDAASLRDRFVRPLAGFQEGPRLAYLFNYSVAPAFVRTKLSADLVKTYAEAVLDKRPEGLAAVTVSEQGASVARKFGLSHVGDIHIGDAPPEAVYVGRGPFKARPM
jgi:hypothetical protein